MIDATAIHGIADADDSRREKSGRRAAAERRLGGGLHLLWWGIGMATYGIGTFTEAYTSIFGWTPAVFRAWYIAGAFLGIGFIIPLRKQMIDFERLPFPSGIAVATILK